MLLAPTLVVSPLAAQNYRITDLGTLGGPDSSANALNDFGQVVGWSQTTETDPFGNPFLHAFLWLPSPAGGMAAGMHDLGTLGGRNSRAHGLNDSLQVVGGAEDGTFGDFGEPLSRPFLWQLGTMTDLGTAHAGHDWARARSINNLGQVVGGEFSSLTCQGFLWLPAPSYGLPAGIHGLPPVPGQPEGEAFAINDAGQVALRSTIACDTTAGTPALWLPAPAHGLPAGSHDLAPGFPPERAGDARAVTASGEVAGVVEDGDFDPFVYLWREGVLTFLPLDPGAFFAEVEDMNDRGQVVGRVSFHGDPPGPPVPMLWQDGEAIPVSTLLPPGSPWTLSTVTGINDRGQMTGRGRIGGNDRAYLLTPVLFEDGFESGDTSAWSATIGD